jgi:hypothetical protein
VEEPALGDPAAVSLFGQVRLDDLPDEGDATPNRRAIADRLLLEHERVFCRSAK